MRIIFVPQFPTNMRYQEWWFSEFPKQFKKRGFEVLTLGEKHVDIIKRVSYDPSLFSPVTQAISFETKQIEEYMALDIKSTDILFVSDISFPGLFCNILFHKRCPSMYAFCHATSINYLDYFAGVAQYKFPIESEHASMFNKVFIGSKYHQLRLQWPNTMVTYLPFPSITTQLINIEKTIDIMSASRPSPQKVDSKLEENLEDFFKLKIQRPQSNTWEDYHLNLHKSKILLITAFEDTFGYQIVDAVMNNCIPLARRDLAYIELLPDEYLYSNEDELFHKIDYILNANVDWVPKVGVPKLLCEEQMNKFYDVICDEMLGKNESLPF